MEIEVSLRRGLLAEALAASPKECCGLLWGFGGRLLSFTPFEGSGNPDSFEIDSRWLLSRCREGREGQVMMGYYHSHPRGPAGPSAADWAGHPPSALCLIVTRGQVRAFRRSTLVGKFDKVQLLEVSEL